jgi:PhoH-like ATPase
MLKHDRKIIVLDTSVLLYDRKSLENFPGCDVVLPLVVLDELDHFKDKPGMLGENARYINRRLDELRKDGPLHTGVSVENDQTITVRLTFPKLPENFPLDVNDSDNRILLEALEIQANHPGQGITVVSKDINLRVKGDALGLISEDYYSDYIDLPEESWDGIATLAPVDDEIDRLYQSRSIRYDCDMSHNTFVIMKAAHSKQSALCVFDALKSELRLVTDMEVKTGGSSSFLGKNKEQKFAMWALMNENVPLVTMTGLAGSGKTFLSLLSGINQVQQGKYERIVITRNIQPVGKEMGFLPGDADEKMLPWLAPAADNLRNHFKDRNTFDMLRVNGLLEIAPMSFIRGRTFSNSFIILDEAQNATIHELKTVITRVGEGSKIILMGDTDQIDTPYINKHTNGLSIVAKRMRESLHTAHIHLPVGIRSPIASEASHLL